MSNQVSNLYASRIFSEHPSALWALDDTFDFKSLLGQTGKDLSNFILDNLEEINGQTPSDIPLINEDLINLGLISASTLSGSAYFGPINTETDIDPDKGTVSINTFVYDYNGYIDSYDIGFIVNGSPSFTNYESNSFEQWQKIYHKINVPESPTNIYPYIKANYTNLVLEPEADSTFSVNALSVGQWSELYHYESTGFVSASISSGSLITLLEELSTLDIEDITYISADSYGIADPLNGYYLVEKNRMLANNNRLPMTFGATNITSVKYPLYGQIPSLVFPGLGFMNESGRYKELTAEFWIRAFTKTSTPIKIFGPLASEDGLYIERDYITFKIGNYIKSHFVGKWYRPMLIDIRYGIDTASVLLNGDLIIELTIDQNKISFPSNDQDFLGFFGHELVYPFDVDAFAIYSYPVQEQVAKRRFIYAQGVQSFDNIASNFKGDSFTVDFPFAQYTSTINYPDMNDWSGGFFVNCETNSKFLSLPSYSLPEISFTETIDIDNFLQDNYDVQDNIDSPFITLKPNSNYDNLEGRIYFSNLNILSSPTRTLHGIFKSPSTLSATEEVLMEFQNKFNLNVFSIKISSAGIKYYYNNQLLTTKAVEEDQMFIAGIDIPTLSQHYRRELGSFFDSPQNLSLSLGGNLSSTFSGKIYKMVFNNKFFLDKDLSNYVETDGTIDTEESIDIVLKYVGNYTLNPQIISDSLLLDVASSGYWEDSIPLSYFGKNVLDRSGNSYYDLDLIQFNIEVPSPIVFTRDRYAVLDGGFASTVDFDLDFDSGTPQTTEFALTFDGGTPSTNSFDEFLTDEQFDIAFREFGKKEYTVKTYMTLQHYTEVGNTPYSNYTNIYKIGEDRVLDFDSVENFQNTKYEINDGTVIFPPKEQVDFNDFYITIHVEIESKGVIVNPIRIKKMSLSSLAYDESTFYSISSQNGFKMYPFTRSGNTYIMKQKNPFVLYKDTSTYMYKSGDSGISVMPYNSISTTRGLTIPINQQVSSQYLLGGVQLSLMYNKNYTFQNNMQIAKIYTDSKTYDIYIEPELDLQRAKMVVYDEGVEAIGISFYQNGGLVDSPYIDPLIWNDITIAFGESLELSETIGQFEIYEGIMVNNISFYKKSSDILGSTFDDKTWQELRTDSVWGDWLELSPRTGVTYVWDEVSKKLITTTFVIDGKSIYETTYGLSRAIASDSASVNFFSDGIKVFSGTIWGEFAGKAV